MDVIEYNENFSLLEELEIAATFICKGLDEFSNLSNFSRNEDIFHIFYSWSVGIERFQKSLLVLLWNIDESNAEAYEKRLITHSLNDLNVEIKKMKALQFCPQDNALFMLLQHFYTSLRYFRYSVGKYNKFPEKVAFDQYLFDNYKIHSIPEDPSIFIYDLDKIKKLVGRSVSRICYRYHTLIQESIADKNCALSELCYQPNYRRLFYEETKVDRNGAAIVEKISQNRYISAIEFIVFLVNTDKINGTMNYLKQIEPLDFDISFISEYINDLAKGVISTELIESTICLYDEIGRPKERINSLYPLYNQVFFDEDEEE
ncbi:MAG: hypothetical protein WCR02_08110 [Sphaerochaetaceae bacterium]